VRARTARGFAFACSLGLAWPAPAAAQVVLNEIRIDQPGADTDEYFELAGAPGTWLTGLTYLVIGDGAGADASGVIEAVVDLSGLALPASGFFLAAEPTFTLGTPDVAANLNFENGDNVTHLVVQGFHGRDGDDLDIDDDGVLDVTPWTSVVDSIALIAEEPPVNTEFAYAIGARVGPDGALVPGHALRCPDAGGSPVVASFDPAAGADSPGLVNACGLTGSVAASIPQVQGAAHRSPLQGMSVVVRGVVSAVDAGGFYLQDPLGDGDPATSDAVFVFTGSAPGVAIGDDVEVTGGVSEFVPGGAASRNLSLTQIVQPSLRVLGAALALPAPVVLGRGGRPLPSRTIDDDAFAIFDPASDGIDFFESLEGMRVTAPDARAVSGTNRFGETYGVVDGGKGATGLSFRGTLNIAPRDFNPERIQLQFDPDLLPGVYQVDTGAFLGDVTGVLSYAFGSYELLITEMPPAPRASRLQPETSALRRFLPNDLLVASFNVLNLDPEDGDADTDIANGRFAALAKILAHNLRGPDIVALQEVQDNDGSLDVGTTAADRTLQLLVDAVRAAGGPQYAFIDNPFIGDGTNGGEPGGNIRTAFLYDPARVQLAPGSLRTVVTDLTAQQTDPASPFFASRPPLVATFRFRGADLTLVNCHLSSKGGSAPLFGQLQPAAQLQEDPSVNGALDARRAQARVVADFVGGLLDADPRSHVVVLGDMNEFEFLSPIQSILGERLFNLTRRLFPTERYSFVFEGNSQELDQMLVSPALVRGSRFDIVHVNSEFAETDQRASDHDPLLARLRLGALLGRPRR